MASYSGVGQLVRQFSTSTGRNALAKVPLKLYGVNGRYATALYSAAFKEKKLEVVEKELQSFQNLMKTDTKLNQFMKDPTFQKKTKKNAIVAVAKSLKYSNITSNFLAVLSENGRLSKTNNVMNAYNRLMAASRGEVLCEVVTATPLDAAGQKELKAALQGFLKQGQVLNLNIKVNPAIMGGMVVTIGESVIDMSTANKITKYTKVIQEIV